MTQTNITLYVKDGCPQCRMEKKLLDQAQIDYTVRNVSQDPSALKWLQLLNIQQVPVLMDVDANSKPIVGFQEQALKNFITKYHRQQQQQQQ